MPLAPSLHAALVAAHVVSAIVGAAGAYASGLVFLLRRRDASGERSSVRFMAVGGAMARAGLAALIATGALLAATDPAEHLRAPAFQAKATMAAVLVAAACLSSAARRSRAAFLARATVVAVSWAWAIALGLRAGAGASYGGIMAAYAATLVAAAYLAFAARKGVPSAPAVLAAVREPRNH